MNIQTKIKKLKDYKQQLLIVKKRDFLISNDNLKQSKKIKTMNCHNFKHL